MIADKYDIIKAFIETDPECIYYHDNLFDNIWIIDTGLLSGSDYDRLFEIRDRYESDQVVSNDEFAFVEDLIHNYHYQWNIIPETFEFAIPEVNTDIAANLKLEKSNSLIISDDSVAFGLEELPALSKSKVADVFDTRFKMIVNEHLITIKFNLWAI